MWLLPSLNRPHNLTRFARACREVGTATPGLILIDKADYAANGDAYRALDLPKHWRIAITKGVTQGEKLRELWPRYKSDQWIGYLGDDCVPETPGWDLRLISALQGWNFVSCNDCWQAPKRIGNCAVFSGDLIRAVGYFWPPDLDHLYIDDLWENLGRETSCWLPRMDIVVRHVHVMKGEAPEDDTHRKAYSQESWAHDTAVFEEWNKTQKPAALVAIHALQGQRGVSILNANFKGVNLMIATPSITDNYEQNYVTAFMQTFDLIKQHSASCQWTIERYNADIALARSRLISAFLASDCTHCLFIDADMGWDLSAVIRLFAANKDFVAVAGPKKSYPLRFAVTHEDKDGKAVMIVSDQLTGTAEVTGVGLAFALLTRACAVKMAEAYPELGFNDSSNSRLYGLFLPMVEDDRYFSEDFAFCRRWRKIGGKVFICPDVRLKHTGAHTFEGSLMDIANTPGREAA